MLIHLEKFINKNHYSYSFKNLNKNNNNNNFKNYNLNEMNSKIRKSKYKILADIISKLFFKKFYKINQYLKRAINGSLEEIYDICN